MKIEGDGSKAITFYAATKQKGDNNKVVVAFFVAATPKQKAMATMLLSP
jgi:hypothetical protein